MRKYAIDNRIELISLFHFTQGWDRQRRCDLFDYDPPCGVCEGTL